MNPFCERGGPSTGYLYRAVRPDEFADLRALGRLRNPRGIGIKYFTLTWMEAIRYADMAQTAFDDGPYFVIRVKVGVNYTPDVIVDGGIRSVLLTTDQLAGLVPEIPGN